LQYSELQAALADARLEVTRLKALLKTCGQELLASEQERDQQREDIRRLMEALETELQEHDDVGGCESTWGCAPSHALLADLSAKYPKGEE